MRAVLLAAGAGTRMGSIYPKSLYRVGEESLLERHIRILKQYGLDVTIVVGYLYTVILDQLWDQASFVLNRQYGETGSLYSLWLADFLAPRESLIVGYADMFVDSKVIKAVLDEPDSVSMVEPYDGRGTRLYIEDDVVVRASVATDPDPHGLSFGGFAHLSRPVLRQIGKIEKWNTLSATFGFVGCRSVVTDGFAVNVNTPSDLEYVRSHV